jgi:hypothetical protein
MEHLDYCKVMAITGDYDITIITLDMLCFMISCRLTSPDAPSMSFR